MFIIKNAIIKEEGPLWLSNYYPYQIQKISFKWISNKHAKRSCLVKSFKIPIMHAVT